MPLPPQIQIGQFISDPAKIQMPLEHATVQEIHAGTNGRLIIHIQDAHANLSGQQSLAKALDQLMTRYDLRLVLVEGSSRDASLDEIRKLAPLKEWSVIARRFLYEGIISGEEYLNLTTEHPMKIVGVEYRDLYDEAVKAYAAIVDRRKDILHYLYQAKVSLDRLKVRMYPKELKDYEARRGPDDGAGQIDFKTGFSDLLELAERAEYPLAGLDQVHKLKELMARESLIDFGKADVEQQAILKGLSVAGAEAEAREFAEASRRLRYSQVSQYLLVRRLLATASDRQVPIQNFPELVSYAGYLERFTDLDMEQLMTQIEYLEDKVYEKLLPSDDARKVRSIDRFLGLLGNAYKLQMSSHDFGMFTFNEKDFKTEGWLAFMNRQLVDLGFFESLVPYKPYLEEARADFGRFYRLVGERDLAFMENANRIMAERRENAAVLIAGGYHTAHLTKLLREEGTSYIVLTPVVTDTTDHARYEELLLSHLKEQEKRLASTRRDTGAQKAQNVAATRIPRGIRALDSISGARLTDLPDPARAFADARVPGLSEKIAAAAARLAREPEVFVPSSRDPEMPAVPVPSAGPASAVPSGPVEALETPARPSAARLSTGTETKWGGAWLGKVRSIAERLIEDPSPGYDPADPYSVPRSDLSSMALEEIAQVFIDRLMSDLDPQVPLELEAKYALMLAMLLSGADRATIGGQLTAAIDLGVRNDEITIKWDVPTGAFKFIIHLLLGLSAGAFAYGAFEAVPELFLLAASLSEGDWPEALEELRKAGGDARPILYSLLLYVAGAASKYLYTAEQRAAADPVKARLNKRLHDLLGGNERPDARSVAEILNGIHGQDPSGEDAYKAAQLLLRFVPQELLADVRRFVGPDVLRDWMSGSDAARVQAGARMAVEIWGASIDEDLLDEDLAELGRIVPDADARARLLEVMLREIFPNEGSPRFDDPALGLFIGDLYEHGSDLVAESHYGTLLDHVNSAASGIDLRDNDLGSLTDVLNAIADKIDRTPRRISADSMSGIVDLFRVPIIDGLIGMTVDYHEFASRLQMGQNSIDPWIEFIRARIDAQASGDERGGSAARLAVAEAAITPSGPAAGRAGYDAAWGLIPTTAQRFPEGPAVSAEGIGSFLPAQVTSRLTGPVPVATADGSRMAIVLPGQRADSRAGADADPGALYQQVFSRLSEFFKSLPDLLASQGLKPQVRPVKVVHVVLADGLEGIGRAENTALISEIGKGADLRVLSESGDAFGGAEVLSADDLTRQIADADANVIFNLIGSVEQIQETHEQLAAASPLLLAKVVRAPVSTDKAAPVIDLAGAVMIGELLAPVKDDFNASDAREGDVAKAVIQARDLGMTLGPRIQSALTGTGLALLFSDLERSELTQVDYLAVLRRAALKPFPSIHELIDQVAAAARMASISA